MQLKTTAAESSPPTLVTLALVCVLSAISFRSFVLSALGSVPSGSPEQYWFGSMLPILSLPPLDRSANNLVTSLVKREPRGAARTSGGNAVRHSRPSGRTATLRYDPVSGTSIDS